MLCANLPNVHIFITTFIVFLRRMHQTDASKTPKSRPFYLFETHFLTNSTLLRDDTTATMLLSLDCYSERMLLQLATNTTVTMKQREDLKMCDSTNNRLNICNATLISCSRSSWSNRNVQRLRNVSTVQEKIINY